MTILDDFSRRTRYLVLSATILFPVASATIGLCRESSKTDAPRTAREQLAGNRNLYNGDFGVFFWNAEIWRQDDQGPYSAKAIHRFVDTLADNGVDTFVINPNSQVAWYPSKVIPTVMDRYSRDDPTIKQAGWWCHDLLNPALDLKEAGVDPLAEAITQCRRRGVSPWVSVRMNDPHLQHPYLRCPLHEDPKYHLGGLLNYEHPEVRDYYFRLIRELVNDYDIDALELDWLRCPTCCSSAKHVPMMTEWFGQIRKLLDAKGKRRGRPVFFGFRFPANYKLMPSIGIDIEVLVERGMLDFLCPSNFMQTSWTMPIDQFRKDFGEDIAIYGVTELWINESPVWSDRLKREIEYCNCASPPALRGNAAGKLVLGADGVVQYNFFCGDQIGKYDLPQRPGKWKPFSRDQLEYQSHYPALRGLGDLESLRGKTKHYSLSCSVRKYGPVTFDLPRPLPITLEPGQSRTLRLPMCAEPEEAGMELTVQVIVDSAQPAELASAFNHGNRQGPGQPTKRLLFPMGPADRHLPKYQAYNYNYGIDRIHDGWNEITLTNRGKKAVTVISVELAVK